MKKGFDHDVFFKEVFTASELVSREEELLEGLSFHEMEFPTGFVKKLHFSFF
jgi:hypothetical protein